jgi:membrane-bound serine protease (ClpP class)
LGALCLIVAFVSFQVLPIYVGGVILLAIGAGLMLAEVFIVSHGALAFTGVIFLSLGLLWVIDPGQIDLRIGTSVWLSTVGLLTFGSLVIVWAASRIQKLSKRALEQSGGGDLAGLRGYKGQIKKVNPDGHSGVILIRGELWNFFSDRQVEVGEIVKTKDAHGLNVEVL